MKRCVYEQVVAGVGQGVGGGGGGGVRGGGGGDGGLFSWRETYL